MTCISRLILPLRANIHVKKNGDTGTTMVMRAELYIRGDFRVQSTRGSLDASTLGVELINRPGPVASTSVKHDCILFEANDVPQVQVNERRTILFCTSRIDLKIRKHFDPGFVRGGFAQQVGSSSCQSWAALGLLSILPKHA